MKPSNSDTTASPTVRERWAQATSNARNALVKAKTAGEPVTGAMHVRMRLACDVEIAHATALREAERLAELVGRLIQNLETDGPGALTGGNAFESQTNHVAKLLHALELRRESFGMASSIVDFERCETG